MDFEKLFSNVIEEVEKKKDEKYSVIDAKNQFVMEYINKRLDKEIVDAFAADSAKLQDVLENLTSETKDKMKDLFQDLLEMRNPVMASYGKFDLVENSFSSSKDEDELDHSNQLTLPPTPQETKQSSVTSKFFLSSRT